MRTLVRCGEDGAEPEGEAFSLLVHLCSNHHRWSQIWVVAQKIRLWIQAAEIGCQRVAELSYRDSHCSSI